MIAGDVRTLARGCCANATAVWYELYDEHTHISSLLIWVPNGIARIKQRFAGQPAGSAELFVDPGAATRSSRFRFRQRPALLPNHPP